MKRLVILLILLLATTVHGDIDTFVGKESIDTFVGIESIGDCVGVAIAGGGGCVGGPAGVMGQATGTDGDTMNDGYCAWQTWQPGTAGSVANGHVRVGYLNSGFYANVAIYNAAGTTKLAEGSSVDEGDNQSNQVMDFTLDSTVCLVAATDYRLAVCSDESAWSARNDNGQAPTWYYYDASWTAGSMPATMTSTANSITTSHLGVLVNNTP